MDEELYKNIEKLLELERESLALNSELLTDLMNRGVKDITKLDHVADRLLDVMHGFSGEGEDVYHQYLDYIAMFDPIEAKQRRDNLEYDLWV